MSPRRRLPLVLLLALLACTEEPTAPGVCPNFCPGGSIDIRDTIFTDIINRDSSFRGYVPPYGGEAWSVADLPGVVDSRAFFVMNPMIVRIAPVSGDTTTVPITADSSRLRLVITRYDSSATNLKVRLFALPNTSDSTSTFASLDPDFNSPPIDSFDVSGILARPKIGDTASVRIYGDTIRTDSAGHVLVTADSGRTLILYFHLDTLKAPLTQADSGKLGYGIRVTADSFASVLVGSAASSNNPTLLWYYHFTVANADTTKPDSIANQNAPRVPQFGSFVFTPPSAPLDSNLTVGGVPSARSLLRVALPKFLHDSVDVVRATLSLIPVAAVPGAPSDSFVVRALPLLSDLGAKSPLSSVFASNGTVHTESTDTVRIELTDLVRAWVQDTTAVTAFLLGQIPEASMYSQVSFYSSRVPAFRPSLRVTYVKRFKFGTP